MHSSAPTPTKEFQNAASRVGHVVDNAIDALAGSATSGELTQVLTEFKALASKPLAQRRTRIAKLLVSLDTYGGHGPDDLASSERLLLLIAAQDSARLNADAFLPEGVRLQILYGWLLAAAPPARTAELFNRVANTFEAACETALLLRMPAGQLSWVREGLDRRLLLTIPRSSAAKLMWNVMRHMHGFSPAYFAHANGFRHNRFTMLELEARRSYLRMAAAIRDDPGALGIVAISWYHDPDLSVISPHLSWMNGIIEEGGGVVVRAGVASKDSGVFENSTTRREAAAHDAYAPRDGIVLWPRARVLAWADTQTALDDDAPTYRRLNKILDGIQPAHHA